MRFVYCDKKNDDIFMLEQKMVMYDHHGKDGIRYEDPLDVCGSFVLKEEK